MKHNRLALLTLPAAALFAFIAPVQSSAAQDQFTFTANLDANQLHEDTAQVGFTCRVCDIPNCGGDGSIGSGVVASFLGVGMLKFPVSGQTRVNQSVTLGVNVNPGENPAAVQGWWCRLQTHETAGFENLPHPGAGHCIPNTPTTAGHAETQHNDTARTITMGSF